MGRYDDLNKIWDDRTFKAYGDATDNPWKWVIGGIIALVLLIAVVVFGGWEAKWWFTSHNESRTTQVIRHSLGYQSNISSEIDAFFGNIETVNAQIQSIDVQGPEVSALKAQRYADLTQLCAYAAQADSNTLNSQQRTFVNSNCSNGAVSPSSSYTH